MSIRDYSKSDPDIAARLALLTDAEAARAEAAALARRLVAAERTVADYEALLPAWCYRALAWLWALRWAWWPRVRTRP